MPVDLHCMSEGWLELESDPGLFTLLIEDFGCRGVQVEEIYDLQKPRLIDGPVYGFIFLFKWLEERRSRTRYNQSSSNTSDGQDSSKSKSNNQPVFVEDEDTVNSIFFAQQLISNSCATHALVSVLLNSPTVDLGPVLTRLKQHTHGMSPENKGYSMGNSPELARAHNKHASHYDLPDSGGEKLPTSTTSRSVNQIRIAADSFHFVSYVPINNRLYELDGLKKFPVDHGPIAPGEDWTERFKQIITIRLSQETQSHNSSDGGSHDIRYNLMAVVPDKRVSFLNKLNNLRSNRKIVLEALERMMRPIRLPEPLDYHNYSRYPTVEGRAVDPPPSPKIEILASPKKRAEIEKPLSVDTTAGYSIHYEPIYTSASSSLISPLTVQTNSSISPTLSVSSSATDTCSEAGSAFNSPNPGCSSTVIINPNERISKFFVCKVLKSDRSEDESMRSSDPMVPPDHLLTPTSKRRNADLLKRFAPRDMVALLKGLEEEIAACENNLKEELEKRRKYRIDDSRRTHNYEEFITTFILMLAEQGKLPDLLEKALNSNGPVTTATDTTVEPQPDSPSTAFFEELLSMNFNTTHETSESNEMNDDTPDKPVSEGLAEFMTKITSNHVAEPTEPEPQYKSIAEPVVMTNGNMGSAGRRRNDGVRSRRRRRGGASHPSRHRYRRR